MHFALTTDNGHSADNAELDSLLTDISDGNRDSLERLYRITSAAVYSFALSILKNPHDAQDALHDCYVAVWHGASGYSSHGKPMAWMLTIARNLCMQRLRDHRKTEEIPAEDWESQLPASDRLSVEDRTVLRTCLERLTDEERQIVVLYAVSGFRHREIAALLRLPTATVLSKYHRALKKLKEYLQ